MTYSLEQIDNWASDHRMWMGRCSEHPMLETVAGYFQSDLSRLRDEISNPSMASTLEYDYHNVIAPRRKRLHEPPIEHVPFTSAEIDAWHGTHVIYMRRVRWHLTLGLAVKLFRIGLGILDRELNGPNDKRPTFDESLAQADAGRARIILSGRST